MNRSDAYTILCGGDWHKARPLVPFADEVLAFLSELSALLMKTPAARSYPDVITFAFFCRRAHLEQLKADYEGALDSRIGRGLSFHIAPSNVPINFAYSLVAALLAGNACVVKASSQDFPQTRMVCSAIRQLLEGTHQALENHVNVVIYPREKQEITEMFSAVCDSRIIWGGDETVRRVRMAALSPHANEVTFPDRYSLLAIKAEAVLQMDEKQLAAVAQGFYNDTYLTDQNACTAPRLVYWLGSGESLLKAQERFWNAVHSYAKPLYPLEAVVAVDKRIAAYRAALQLPDSRIVPTKDNLIVRIRLDRLTPEIEKNRCAGGFFLEYAAETLEDLAPVVERKYQTLSYLGLEADTLRRFVREHRLTGIDRIAPVGATMDFALTWDGIDLIRTLSRSIFAI